MKRTYLYPSFLLSIPIGIVCFICFFGALVILNNPTASLIMALAGLLILCVGSYTCPIVSFDEERIYIHRLFPGTTKRIRWEEIRSISPLEHGGLAGLACLICTDKKEYALTIFLRGWHKLLGHWDSIRPAAATAPLKRNLLLEGTYQKPFWKTSGFFIALFMLFLWLCTYPATNGGQYLIGFILLFSSAVVTSIITSSPRRISASAVPSLSGITRFVGKISTASGNTAPKPTSFASAPDSIDTNIS